MTSYNIVVYGATNEVPISSPFWANHKAHYVRELMKKYPGKTGLFFDDMYKNVNAVNDSKIRGVKSYLIDTKYGSLFDHSMYMNMINKFNKHVLIFDFDQTLFRGHSGGYPFYDTVTGNCNFRIKNTDGQIKETIVFTNSEAIIINTNFMKWLKNGNQIYIVSRGMANLIIDVLKAIFKNNVNVTIVSGSY